MNFDRTESDPSVWHFRFDKSKSEPEILTNAIATDLSHAASGKNNSLSHDLSLNYTRFLLGLDASGMFDHLSSKMPEIIGGIAISVGRYVEFVSPDQKQAAMDLAVDFYIASIMMELSHNIPEPREFQV